MVIWLHQLARPRRVKSTQNNSLVMCHNNALCTVIYYTVVCPVPGKQRNLIAGLQYGVISMLPNYMFPSLEIVRGWMRRSSFHSTLAKWSTFVGLGPQV